MRGLSLILKPLSWLYGFILWVRHQFYDRGFFFSQTFNQPIIKIGNLSFGGTGKTPMTIFLAEYLKSKYPVSVLSRGYSRSSAGFIEVLNESSVDMVGDEPLLIKQRMSDVNVFVCESRVEGIEKINIQSPENNIIILDDALQHRALAGGFTILLTDWNLPFFSDSLTPNGSLRDLKRRASAANLIVVSKCPSDISQNKRLDLIAKVQLYTTAPVVFSHIEYSNPINLFTRKVVELKPKIIVATSIAKPFSFLAYLNSISSVLYHFEFPDHYSFKKDTVYEILTDNHFYGNGVTQLVITEKDGVKLAQFKSQFDKYKIELIVVPINTYFDDADTILVNEMLEKYLRSA